jgi:glycosyltransferase involved in cell wall biosynthesis
MRAWKHLSNAPTITLIVPALNEEAVIAQVLERIYEHAAGHFRDFELIAVNDGSTDRTGEIMDGIAARHPQVRVLHNKPNIGLGASFQRGLREAHCQYVMLLCGDGGLPARSLPAIFERIGTADLIIPHMSNLRSIKSPARYLISRTYTGLLNLLFGFNLKYYNGLPVYRRSLLNAIRITSAGFGFQGEILVKLLKSGCTYVEVGVEGAEEKGRSFALRPTNILSVSRTLLHLILEILRFRPVPPEVIARSRQRDESHEFVERPLP